MAGTCSGPGPCDTSPTGTGGGWVSKVGGLPLYVRAIVHALKRHGHSESEAVQLAIGTVQRWARGEGNVSAATRARAAKALAEWEAKRAAAHALAVEQGAAVDLAADPGMPHRYRHGWIPVGPSAPVHGHPMGALVGDAETGMRAVMADGHARTIDTSTARQMVERLRGRGVHARVEPVTTSEGKRHLRVFDPARRQPVNLTAEQRESVDLSVWDESKHPRKGGKFAPKGTQTQPGQPKPAGMSEADAKGLGLPTDPALRAAYIQAYQLLTGQAPTGTLDAAGMAKLRAAVDPARDGSGAKGRKGKLTPAQRAARKAAAAQRAHNARTASSVNRLDPTQRARYRKARPKPPAGYAWSAKGDRLVSTKVSASAEGRSVAAVAGAPGAAKGSRRSLRGSRKVGPKYRTTHLSTEQGATVDLAALTHNWRHGWIPLTPVAALQKAHGSHAGAARLLAGNGQHDEAHAMLRAGLAHHEAKGNTKMAARYRTALGGPHPAPHTLTPGEHATVRGVDHTGQPITLTGRVASNSPSSMFAHGRTTGGQPMRTIAVERTGASGMTRTDHVNVPDPSRGEQTRKSNAQALAEARGARTPSAVEVARGYDMYGNAIPKADTPATTGRIHVEHTGDGTLVHGTTREDAPILKRHGFRWSRNLSAWYLPRTQTEHTRAQKVDALEADLKGAGVPHHVTRDIGVTTTAAEREAAAKARAAGRAERMDARAARLAAEADAREKASRQITDMIPMGQPILVGHHSEGRHRRDIARAHSHMEKSWEADQAAKAAARSAEIARHTAAGDSPLLRQRRIDRNAAELRSIERTLAQHKVATAKPEAAAKFGIHPLADEHRARLEAARAQLADQIAHDKAQIDASGHKAITAEQIRPGDVIHYRGRTHVVAKVNKTTVSVPTPYSWEDKVPINQITKHAPLADMPTESIRAAIEKTTNAKLKAAFAAELKRRNAA